VAASVENGPRSEGGAVSLPATSASRILILLVLSVAINYLDRGILSVSAPLLQRELTLSSTEMGLLFSAFFWSYSVF
jgi:MFS transporter, ACS family, D-galactonate transporter